MAAIKNKKYKIQMKPERRTGGIVNIQKKNRKRGFIL